MRDHVWHYALHHNKHTERDSMNENIDTQQVTEIISSFYFILESFDISEYVKYSHKLLEYVADFKQAADDYLLCSTNGFNAATLEAISELMTEKFYFKSLSQAELDYVGEMDDATADKESDRFIEINNKAREELEEYCLAVLYELID